MSKSIQSYPVDQRPRVIARRLAAQTMGLGYWAAVDAEARKQREHDEAAAAKRRKKAGA